MSLERARRGAVLWALPGVALAVVVGVRPWDAGWLALWLLLAGAVLEAFPVELGEGVRTTLASVVMLLGVLLGGAQLAVAAVLGSALAVVVLLPPGARLLKGTYNAGMFSLSAAAAAGVFAVASGGAAAPDPVTVGRWIPATIAAMLAYHLSNVALLSLALWVTGGPRPARTVPGMLADGWWAQLLSLGFGMAAYVVLVEAGAAALALLLVPLLSARRALAGATAERDALDRAVRALVRLVEVKDAYTRGHAERVAELSDRVARRMGLDATQRYWIRIGAVLHDVGKIGVPLEVLTKPGALTEAEYWQMRRHPDVGADLLDQVDALAPAVPLVRQHHERLDGCGYPRGLSADDLPLGTRIISAVDAWDAMVTTRPYRDGLDPVVAVAELRAHVGTQFDARVVAELVAEVAPEHVVEPAPEPVEVAGAAAAGVTS